MTEFLMAAAPSQFRKCQKFLRENGLENIRLSRPTIYAERDGEIVGLLGTNKDHDLILAEPMFVKVDGNPVFLYVKLVDIYDKVMIGAGVGFYHFHIPDKNRKHQDFIEKFLDSGFDYLGKSDFGKWYRRRLTDGIRF